MMELTEEQFERVLHHAFLLALRVSYDAHNIDVAMADDPAWDLLREVADGKTTVNRSPADYLRPDATPEIEQRAWENMNQMVIDDRIIANAILADRVRMFDEKQS